MAEKKTEKKEKATVKKPTAKAATKKTKKTGEKKKVEKVESKKTSDVKVEAKTEVVKEIRTKKDHKVLITAVLTFFITTLLFGMAFFVFMNLEVISDDGLVRIRNGSIRIDGRKRGCVDEEVQEEGGRSIDGAEDGSSKSGKDDGSVTEPRELIDNPDSGVTVRGAQLVEVGDFEFYLPNDFELAKGNSNGKYVYNLKDDEGWADVKVYTEKTSADIVAYMQKKDPLLRVTNSDYKVNGTSWVGMESGSSEAYGVKLNETIYVVILNVKLGSGTTEEAEQMISKTIHLKKVYK